MTEDHYNGLWTPKEEPAGYFLFVYSRYKIGGTLSFKCIVFCPRSTDLNSQMYQCVTDLHELSKCVKLEHYNSLVDLKNEIARND